MCPLLQLQWTLRAQVRKMSDRVAVKRDGSPGWADLEIKAVSDRRLSPGREDQRQEGIRNRKYIVKDQQQNGQRQADDECTYSHASVLLRSHRFRRSSRLRRFPSTMTNVMVTS